MGERDYKIAAVDRALAVLEALGREDDQTLTALAARLSLNKSQVFRILQTLEARGFVARDAERGTFALGLAMSLLGARAGVEKGLVAIAAPTMDELRDATAENVNLLVREGNRALVLASREGRHSMRLFAQAGRYGPLHAGGASMVLLAFAPDAVIDEVLAGPLKKHTDATLTDPASLRRRIRKIRADGSFVSKNDFEEGAFSIAAPIFGADGAILAALSVAGALARLDPVRTRAHEAAVRAAAAGISERIGRAPERAAA